MTEGTQKNDYYSRDRKHETIANSSFETQHKPQPKIYPTYQNGSYSREIPREKVVLNSNNFNFDDYERITDEKGRIMYKKKNR